MGTTLWELSSQTGRSPGDEPGLRLSAAIATFRAGDRWERETDSANPNDGIQTERWEVSLFVTCAIIPTGVLIQQIR